MSEHYLSCPSCGDEVRSLPAYRPNPRFPYGYWSDGDTCKCHCGSDLQVGADGECAWLQLIDCDTPHPQPQPDRKEEA